ncbi:hypothetical protein ACFFRR_004730 [Megaselia abdita]
MIKIVIFAVLVSLVCAYNNDQNNQNSQNLQSQIPCGFKNNGVVRLRLYGPEKDTAYDDREFPWVVEILFQEQAYQKHHCGGSLIHPQIVLTAAHCVQNKNVTDLRLRAGECDTNPMCDFEKDQYRGVSEIVVHEEYYKGGLYNDIALLMLDAPFEIDQYVRTVCLPPPNVQSSNCFATGWGLNYNQEAQAPNYNVAVQKISVPIVPRQQCESTLKTSRLGESFVLHKSFLCAGGETTKDTTQGDGGAPLVCEFAGESERFYQLGIVSYGVLVGSSYPGVYADVSVLRGWVDRKLQERGVTYLY